MSINNIQLLSPVFHLDSINIPHFWVLSLFLSLPSQSLTLLVFACYECHGIPLSSLVHLVNSQLLNTMLFPSQPSSLDPPPRTSSVCGCLSYVSRRNYSSRSQPSRSYSAGTLPCRPDHFLILPSRSIFFPYHGFAGPS